MTEHEDQDEQLKALFATFADEPPPTSMSSLKITAMALSGSQSRTRRRNRVLGIAAAVVVLGVGGAVLVPKFAGTSADDAASASSEVLLLQTVTDSGAAAFSVAGSAAGQSAAELAAPQTVPAAGGAESVAGGAQSAAGSAAEMQSAGPSQESAADAAGAGSVAPQTSAAPAAASAAPSVPEFADYDWSVGVGMEPVGGLPTGSTACLLPALPEAGLQQVAESFSSSDSQPVRLTAECNVAGAGSAVRVGDAMLMIYWLDDVDPCATQCYPGPAADVRYSSAMSGVAVVISAVDGRYLVLEPLLRDASDPVTLTEIGRAVLAATAE